MAEVKKPKRTSVESGARWEAAVGYSRAVRVGDTIAVTGTIGLDEAGKVVPGGMFAQSRRALEIVVGAIEALGGSPADIIRTRMFVTDIEQWAEAGRTHAEVLGEIRPATTMVEVARLITTEALIEIEADAIVSAEA